MLCGVDLVEVNRIRGIKNKLHFVDKICNPSEREYLTEEDSTSLAGFFASKEAISKLLKTGIGAISFKDIEIIHGTKGEPLVRLHGKAFSIAKAMGIKAIELSISHERNYAVAIAVAQTSEAMNISIDREIAHVLKTRDPDTHKGNYGKVGILGGSRGMSGAVYLSSLAALRTGSGLVYTLIPSCIESALSAKSIENIIVPIGTNVQEHIPFYAIDTILDKAKDYDALAIGPGMGWNDDTGKIVQYLLRHFDGPIVLDADAINSLASQINVLYNRPFATILTPHLMEFSRLSGNSLEQIKNDRRGILRKFIGDSEMIIVLKGYQSMIVDCQTVYRNSTGNAGMATAGSGDVLTGMILSLLGQKYSPLDAARLGVYLHGLSGDIFKERFCEESLIATDIIKTIPMAYKILRNEKEND